MFLPIFTLFIQTTNELSRSRPNSVFKFLFTTPSHFNNRLNYLHYFLSSYICGEIAQWQSLNHPSSLHNHIFESYIKHPFFFFRNLWLIALKSMEDKVPQYPPRNILHSLNSLITAADEEKAATPGGRRGVGPSAGSRSPWQDLTHDLLFSKDVMPGFPENTESGNEHLA